MSALLDSAIAQIGQLHDGPDVVRLAREIAALRPQEYDYWAEAATDTPWCGIFIAHNLVKAGIPLPKSPNSAGVGAMYVNWWLNFGIVVLDGQEQPGDIAIFLGNPHHVTFVAGGGYCVGGNQLGPSGKSDSVTRAHYRTPDAIRRPPPPAQIITIPDKPVPFVPLDQRTIDAITIAAAASDLARYSWADRGRAPIGYIKGMAVTFGQALRKLAARDSAALAMVRVVEDGLDVFDHYNLDLLEASYNDRLRALFVILTGLGMRESSGDYQEGIDALASNTSADTAEAGLFQQSWNSRAASPEISKLLSAYAVDEYPSFVEIFREGLRVKVTKNYGEGDGLAFQSVAKSRPAFAVEAAAIGLRTLYTHWGPIIRREAEVRPEADALFRQVQEIVGAPSPAPQPQPNPPPSPIEGNTMDINTKLAIVTETVKAEPDVRAIVALALGTGTGTIPPPADPAPPVPNPPVVNPPVVVTPPVPAPPVAPTFGNNMGIGAALSLLSLALGMGGFTGLPFGDAFSQTGLWGTFGPIITGLMGLNVPAANAILPAKKA